MMLNRPFDMFFTTIFFRTRTRQNIDKTSMKHCKVLRGAMPLKKLLNL